MCIRDSSPPLRGGMLGQPADFACAGEVPRQSGEELGVPRPTFKTASGSQTVAETLLQAISGSFGLCRSCSFQAVSGEARTLPNRSESA
eukprot:3238147-Alexandrium_andersonii.AAC.1